jgi:DNA-binding transcriptional LysR family regulator
MSKSLNPRQIEAFRAVMATGGMTAAGEMIHVSQPAVSRLIRDLEADFGIKLFERNGTNINPTEEALILFQEVERLHMSGERLREMAMALRRRRAGNLRIAAIPSISSAYLPAIVRRFLAARPTVGVVIHSDNSLNIVDLVAKNQYDVGLVEVPAEYPGVDIHPLPSMDAVCVIPIDHPLAAKDVIHAVDLDGADFIVLTPNSLLKMHIQATLRSADIKFNREIEVRYSAIACSFAAQGLGVTIVEPFAVMEADHGRVVQRPFRPRIQAPFSIVLPSRQRNASLGAEFGEEVRAAMERDFGAMRPDPETMGGRPGRP